MGAPRKAALLFGVGVLACLPAGVRAEDAPSAVTAPARSADGTAGSVSPLRGGTAADETVAFAPADEFVVPGTGEADEPAPAEAAQAAPAIPASLPDPAPSLVLDEPEPARSAALPEPSTTGSGAAEPATARIETPASAAPPSPAATTAPEPARAAAPAPLAPFQGQASQERSPQERPAEGQAAAPAPAPADPLTAAIAARLADEKVVLHPRLQRREREAIAAFYALGAYQPIWIKRGAWTPAAARLGERLKAAGEDALEPGEYPVPALGVAAGEGPADLAEAELKLAVSAVLYARDARGGRLEPSRVHGLITPTLALPTADSVLTQLAAAADAGAALQAYNPPHAGYQALRAKLAETRASRPGQPLVQVPDGPVLKLGMRDPRVPLIRARFNLDPVTEEAAYDERVASAVASFQRENGLRADGQLTRQTVAALGGRSPLRLEADLIANMERWRWLPADLGARHILVNIPEYRLRVMNGGQVAHQTRVIVGKPETPTPVFTGAMDHAIVNPSWFVPPSIVNKEFKGANGQISARAGYEVIRRGNQVSVRQPPGPRNALGNIKFMFPNQHAVYLHDTPSRHLFSAERRAFSHGCVRVDQPFALGAELLGADGWSEARLRGLVGHGERTIKLGAQVPVHLTYFTLSVDESGQVRGHDDLYGYHARLKRALGLAGGAEVAAPGPRPVRQGAARPPARRKPVQQARPVEAVPAPAPAVAAARPPLLGWLFR